MQVLNFNFFSITTLNFFFSFSSLFFLSLTLSLYLLVLPCPALFASIRLIDSNLAGTGSQTKSAQDKSKRHFDFWQFGGRTKAEEGLLVFKF